MTDYPTFIRASGDCICKDCGKPYFKHLYDQTYLDYNNDTWLIKLCNGQLVKL